MKLEELSNYQLMLSFVYALGKGDLDFALELQEEIFCRMEDGEA